MAFGKKLKEIMSDEETNEDAYYTEEAVSLTPGSGKMILLEPRAFSESQQIADHLKKRNTVVVNMKRVTPEQAKRIIDFLSGTVYAIGGDLQKIGVGIFLCTPKNVNVEGTICEISDNYYYGNSIVFSDLNLESIRVNDEKAVLKVTASLANPKYYDEDILNKTLYDVYVNDKYVKTVNSTVFDLEFGDLDIYDVYVIPTISNRKTNELTLVSTRSYIFVSQGLGDDNYNGLSRQTPVKTIKKALQLAIIKGSRTF